MTPEAFRAALAELGWPARYVARRCGYAEQIAAQWANGRSSVPPAVAQWLEKLAQHHRKHPAPKRAA